MSGAGQDDSEVKPEPAGAKAPDPAPEADDTEETSGAAPVSKDDGADGAAREEASAPAASAESPVGIDLRFAGRTAVGLVREHNEDNFVIANLTSAEVKPRDLVCQDVVGKNGNLFAVCDGMGGAAAGEVASQMAVDILYEAMRRGGVPKDRDALARRLVGAVEEAGRRIFDSAQKERSRRGMGTTATVAVLVDKVLFLAEVGDSRAYLLRRGELKQITKDQSLVNQLIEAGHLTEDEAEAFEHSNIILQALGTSETVQVDLTFVELRKGDRLMMCSDGLSGLVHADTLREVLEELDDPDECCGKLIEYAEGGGGHDNITVIVADFTGEGLADPTDKDSFGYVQYPLPLEDGESGAFVDEDTTASGVEARPGDEAPQATPTVPSGPAEAPKTSLGSVLWLSSGVLALIAALAVWAVADPKDGRTDLAEGTAAPAPAPEPPPAAEPDPVRVKIHTDVERATLVVNGEARGPLTSAEGRTLELTPGAYRLEAQDTDGNQAAVEVVSVRSDTPMDVYLKLPPGATPGTEPEGEEPEGEEPGAEVGEGAAIPSAPEQQAEPAAAKAAPRTVEREPAAEVKQPSAAPKPAAKAPSQAPEAAAPRPKPKPKPKPKAPSAPAPAPPPAAPSDPIPENPF